VSISQQKESAWQKDSQSARELRVAPGNIQQEVQNTYYKIKITL
jgi:hypothetical protein